MDYTHLKVYTGHSLNKSIIKIDNLVEELKKRNNDTLVVTDSNNIFNAVSMYESSVSSGLKPVIAVNLNVYDGERKYEMSFYVKNKKGYNNLNRLLTRAWTENNKGDNTGIVEQWLTKESTEGLIALSGAKQGKIGQLIIEDNLEAAKESALNFKNIFGNDFFIELQRDATEHETKYINEAVIISNDLGIAPVATHPVYFLKQEDFFLHEIKTCINSQDKVYDQSRPLLYNKEMYLKNSEEMTELFSDIPQAIENTNLIAKKCNFQLELGKNYLPEFPTNNGESEAQFLVTQSNKGLEKRLQQFSVQERKEKEQEYQERLNTELAIINKMGFAGYFLIVADFINHTKEKGMAVGPGRGSGAGSLVAYSLGITNLDPIPYNLLFERFLNPERVSMPDFDIDFSSEGRIEAIQYVKNKYGHDKVAQICTIGTSQSKAAIKDVGKVLGYPYGVTDTITKLINIPPAKAHEIDLETFLFGNEKKGIEPDEKLLNLYNTETDVKTIIDLALQIEGLPRQIGMHAGGVLISPSNISDFTPLYKKDSQSDIVSQFDKDAVEKAGLVKFDFLVTDILTILQKCINKINEKKQAQGQELLDIDKIDLKDEAVYSEIFGTGNTTGIFQFESDGMKSLFKKINPDKFEDIVALNALYRPGPMDIIPDWIESRNTPDDERFYPHPMLEGILKETYGYMIYQEQVMQCAQIIAGYSLGGADMLRRAMGKKKPEEMAKQRSIFIEGAAKNGIDEAKATELFDLIEKFSGYGFNKSHAAAYSLVAYQTAYLKYYYTADYISCYINEKISDTDAVYKHIIDAQRNKLRILVPDINKSDALFTVENSDSLRYGLASIKGVGETSINFIKSAREEKGEFTDIFDFLEKIPKGTIQKRNFDPMIQAGVFDSIYPNRAELLENSKKLLEYHKKFNENKIETSNSILAREIPGFAETNIKDSKVKIIDRPEIKATPMWDERITLEFEKAAVGFYLTGDPVKYYVQQLNGFKASDDIAKTVDLYNSERKNKALVSGIITEIREYKSKNGAFVTIYNNNEVLEMLVKKEFFTNNPDAIKVDNFAAFEVSIFEGGNGPDDLKFSVKNVYDLAACQKMLVEKVFVACDNNTDNIEKFNTIAKKYPGQTIFNLCVERVQGGRKDLIIAQERVEFSEQLVNELENEFGKDWVKMKYNEHYNYKTYNNNYKKVTPKNR